MLDNGEETVLVKLYVETHNFHIAILHRWGRIVHICVVRQTLNCKECLEDTALIQDAC